MHRIPKHYNIPVSQNCHSPSRRSSICSNPEFLSTIATVSTLLANIEAVKGRVEGMWLTRGEKLEATYKQQTFEQEANQVSSGRR